MGTVSYIWDRLTNIVTGQGTTADKRTASFYAFVPLTPQEAEAAYRTSWLVRKIVDIPPFDMTREWRDWQAQSADIEALEAEEQRLQLKAKCQRALVLARLFGGGALILGTGDADTTQPLNPERVQKGGLKYLHVMSRWQLSEGEPRMDPADPWFMQPDYFTINSSAGATRLHPSRVVAFVGQRRPEGSLLPAQSWFWGDPIMQSIGDAIRNADTAQAGFSSLVDRAAVDVFQFKDLMLNVGTEAGEKQIQSRVTWTMLAKSQHRAVILDADDKWEQVQATFAGVPDTMLAFMDMVAGAADIPLTRLLGQSPRGLQSTGDGEQRDYQSMVKARQSEMLSPALDVIDQLLIRSALRTEPSDIYYEFGSLEDVSEKDASTAEFQRAQAFKIYSDSGDLPDEARSAILRNWIIESGRWPGSEAAFEEADAAAAANPEPDQDEAELTTLEQRVAAMEKAGTITTAQKDALLTDAAPRTLYVSRKLLNADAVVAWAKSQGFETTVPADQMHVTVLYSKTPVDWMAMGQPWDQDASGRLTVPPGGPRMIDQFGSLKEATVLLFNSSSLCWRHEDMISKGATSDYSDYAPHVTITYAAPDGLDLSKLQPYQGELVFGPEVFAEAQDDWQSTIEEE